MTAKSRSAASGRRAPARPRRKKAAPSSRGLAPLELSAGAPPAELGRLQDAIQSDGGSILGVYRDPLGGLWQIFAGLPVEKVLPTPFQRDLSQAHVKRLTDVIDRIGRYLDPIIAVRNQDGTYWTPNGYHRISALKTLGARSIVALVLPETRVAYRILALNTEKAHNLREKALEVIRMARSLAEREPKRPESDFSLEFEQAALVTLGIAYEKRARLAGGVYHPILRRIDGFFDVPLPEALERRGRRAERLLLLDDAVAEAVAALKARGFESPYLRAFVVARVNPIRFQKSTTSPFDETIEKMLASARRFDPGRIKAEQLAVASGPPAEE
jgi:ParB family transcriptional regulator, chromosome partitioning protein